MCSSNGTLYVKRLAQCLPCQFFFFFLANNFYLIISPQYTEESFNAAGIWWQSWATSLPIPFQLVLWWQNRSSHLYCLLRPLRYLQNKGPHRLFSSLTSVVTLPLLDVPSFWALVCLSWAWPSPCHPYQQQEVCSASLDPLHRDNTQILASVLSAQLIMAPAGRQKSVSCSVVSDSLWHHGW